MKWLSFCDEVFIDKFLKILRWLLLFSSTCQDETLVNIFPKRLNGLLLFFTTSWLLFFKDILVNSTSIFSFRLFSLFIIIFYFFESIGIKTDFIGLFEILSIEYFIWITYFCHFLKSIHVFINMNCFYSHCCFALLYLWIIFCSNSLVNNYLFSWSFFTNFNNSFLKFFFGNFYLDWSLNGATFFSSTLTKDPFRIITFMSGFDWHDLRGSKKFILWGWFYSKMLVFSKMRKSSFIFLISLMHRHNKMKTLY